MLDDSPRSIAQARFQLKNENRKLCHERSKKDYRNGRKARRLVARNGAFGDKSYKIWNLLIIGTTGTPRDSEDELTTQ